MALGFITKSYRNRAMALVLPVVLVAVLLVTVLAYIFILSNVVEFQQENMETALAGMAGGLDARIAEAKNTISVLGSRPIRLADAELNRHFAGTYMAYLVLEDRSDPNVTAEFVSGVRKQLLQKIEELAADMPKAKEVSADMEKTLAQGAATGITKAAWLDRLADHARRQQASAGQDTADVWYELADFFELQKEQLKPFKQPQMLRYMADLEDHLEATGLVGKSNSVATTSSPTNRT